MKEKLTMVQVAVTTRQQLKINAAKRGMSMAEYVKMLVEQDTNE
jgi:hypothetical protein